MVSGVTNHMLPVPSPPHSSSLACCLSVEVDQMRMAACCSVSRRTRLIALLRKSCPAVAHAAQGEPSTAAAPAVVKLARAAVMSTATLCGGDACHCVMNHFCSGHDGEWAPQSASKVSARWFVRDP